MNKRMEFLRKWTKTPLTKTVKRIPTFICTIFLHTNSDFLKLWTSNLVVCTFLLTCETDVLKSNNELQAGLNATKLHRIWKPASSASFRFNRMTMVSLTNSLAYTSAHLTKPEHIERVQYHPWNVKYWFDITQVVVSGLISDVIHFRPIKWNWEYPED